MTDVVAPKTRDSQRNKDRGIKKRGVAPHSSQCDQPGPSTQVGPQGELNGDPSADREAGMGRNTQMESDNNNTVANAELSNMGDAREENQPQATTELPSNQFEQTEELRQSQVPLQDKSIEEVERELERELEEWQANVRRANLRRKIQEEKEKSLAIENLSVSQKANHDLTAQEKHNAYLSPTTNQAPRVSKTQNPSVDPITNRPSSSYGRPPQLKKRLREKLHLKDKDFQIAWKVMLDTNEQEAKGRARNINYSNTPRSGQNKQTQAQQQGRANTDNTIICRNHQRYGAKAFTCLDKKCSMRHQTTSPPHAKNELPNYPQ